MPYEHVNEHFASERACQLLAALRLNSRHEWDKNGTRGSESRKYVGSRGPRGPAPSAWCEDEGLFTSLAHGETFSSPDKRESGRAVGTSIVWGLALPRTAPWVTVKGSLTWQVATTGQARRGVGR